MLARRQTAGRGRDGRLWNSPEGNLYLSVLLRPDATARAAPRFALMAAVALAEALEPWVVHPGALRLKWPNDLTLDGAKLAGVLCESAADAAGRIEWLVIGIGANLAVAPAVEGRRTACLAGAAAPPGRGAPTPEAAAPRVIAALDVWRMRAAPQVLAAWQARGPATGTPLTLRAGAGVTTGRYAGLAEDGALLLETAAGLRRFGTGETDGA